MANISIFVRIIGSLLSYVSNRLLDLWTRNEVCDLIQEFSKSWDEECLDRFFFFFYRLIRIEFWRSHRSLKMLRTCSFECLLVKRNSRSNQLIGLILIISLKSVLLQRLKWYRPNVFGNKFGLRIFCRIFLFGYVEHIGTNSLQR